MKMKTVTIVGVGALGSHVVPLLRSVGATLRVIDFDRVETRNTLSQFHAKSAVGKSKVLAAQQLMQFLWATKIETIPHKLVADNARELLGKSDLVLDCLDNGPARRVVQGFVRQEKIPCLHGGLAADGAFARVIWDDDFTIDEASEGAATCEDGEHLPFISLVSSYLAYAAQRFLVKGERVGFQIHPSGAVRI
jgi:molybdopterin-synthase adenylyltransferase